MIEFKNSKEIMTTTRTKSTSKTKSISLVFLLQMMIRATILPSVFVINVVESFQLNKNVNFVAVASPRTFQNVISVSSTIATLPFTFTNNHAYCGQSILEYQRYFNNNNNKNDFIQLYSTPSPENGIEDNYNNTKRNQKKKSTSTKRQETTTSKAILDVQETKSASDLKQPRSRRTWEENFELLKQYKEEQGDCLVPQQYDRDKKLGIWVNTQRKQAKKGKLKTERKHKLDEIGFSWDAKVDNWNFMLEELKEFHEEFGHSNVEKDKYKSRQTLAIWVMTQRQRKPLLTNEQCSQLDELGFVWEDVQKARGDRQWEERFEALLDYQRIYGDTRVPRSASHKGVNLGKWVFNQRQHYRQGILRKDREDQLNSIGFVWKLRDHNATDYEKVNKIWMKNLEKLKDFKRIHNHTNVPQRYEEDPKLGRWVDTQRKHYRLGILKKSRQEMLESIGFEWNPKEKAYEEHWMDLYQDLVEFQNKHGHVDVSYNSHHNLYDWLKWQRTVFANNKLDSDRKYLLEKLGVNLNVGPGSGNIMED